MSVDGPDTPPTRSIGPYELLRRLGAGGMAEVWMSRRTSSGASKTVAVKLLASCHADKPDFRRMFEQEARLTMLLNHSNIVQVFDVGEDDGECYMVMEWVDGVNLSQLITHVREAGEFISLDLAAYIVAELLRALSYAHGLIHDGIETEVIHRDVSPQNVMLSTAGEVKLMDFGIARLSTEETSGVQIKGKLRYMPPEQLRGDARRPTVDLFAVGGVFHELLEGRRFRAQAADEARLYGMIIDGEVPPLELPEGRKLPRELERLRAGLLAANPKRRIQSAKQALRLLYGWSGYRNRSMELEELVRRFVGTEVPRSMGSMAANASATDGVLPATLPVPRRSSDPEAASTNAASHSASLRTWKLDHVVIGSIALVLTASAAGLGFRLAWVEPESTEPGPRTVVAASNEAIQAAPTRPPPPPEPPPPEPPPRVEPSPAIVKPEPADTPPVEAAPMVAVQLLANDYFYVEAKIGGRVYTLNPVVETQIRAGNHVVQLRASAKAPWQKAGRLRLRAGKTHEVEMLDPPGLRVTVR